MLSWIPYQDEIMYILLQGKDSIAYIHRLFIKKEYKLTYRLIIFHVSSNYYWKPIENTNSQPLVWMRSSWRPRNKSCKYTSSNYCKNIKPIIPVKGTTPTRVRKVRVVIKCRICGQVGCNKAICPQKKMIKQHSLPKILFNLAWLIFVHNY